MFTRKNLTILDWLIFFVLMIIPIVNIIVIVILLLSPTTNKTLRSFIWLYIIFIVLGIFLFTARFAHFMNIILGFSS